MRLLQDLRKRREHSTLDAEHYYTADAGSAPGTTSRFSTFTYRLSVACAQGLSLEQSVSQFSHTMTAQADLRVEAAHLRRFLHNFAALRDSITAPEPVAPWVTEAVLVESFEPGSSVDRYIQAPAAFNSKVSIGAFYTLSGCTAC